MGFAHFFVVGQFEMQLSKRIEVLAKESALAENVEFYHMDFRKSGKSWLLRVYIDSESGISHSECEKVSHRLGAKLEVEDIIPDSYTLEISSPGLDRPLVTPEHFIRQIGKTVEIRTFMPVRGAKYFKSKLKDCRNGNIKLEGKDGDIEIPFEAVSKANLSAEY